MKNSTLKTVIITLIAALALTLIVGSTIFYGGFINIAANQPNIPFETWFMHTALERSIKHHADRKSPDLSNTDRAAKGALLYSMNCIFCHTGPGVERSQFSSGLNPFPPKLDHIKNDLDSHELFWIIKYGIKMTGMPAFINSHTDDDFWDIVSFLNQLQGMTEPEFQKLIQSVQGNR